MFLYKLCGTLKSYNCESRSRTIAVVAEILCFIVAHWPGALDDVSRNNKVFYKPLVVDS